MIELKDTAEKDEQMINYQLSIDRCISFYI